MRPIGVSSSQAKDYYYERDPFFAPEGMGKNSSWVGKGAESLGLDGQVKKEDFLCVICGSAPKSGEQLVKTGPGKEHRAGIDITFDAPKSVSIQALHVGDERIFEAHRDAVKRTLQYMEDKYSYARVTANKETRADLQGNMVAATFEHSTSRDNDPQLHTHSLIMNMVNTGKGWRAHWNDQIYKDQKFIRSIYQSELAANVNKLGYSLEHGKNGEWEIAGAGEEVIQKFSKRQNTTEEYLKEHKEELQKKFPKANEAQLRNIAVKESRKAKEFVSKGELQSRWQEEAVREKIKETVLQPGPPDKRDGPGISATEYLTMAVDALHESESTFTAKEVLDAAMRMSRGEHTVIDLERSFADRLSKHNIVKLGEQEEKVKKKDNRTLGVKKEIFSSLEMIKTESGIVQVFEDGKESVQSLLSEEKIKEELEQYETLTAGQRQAIEHILSSKDQFTVIQGDAGTGKTFSMEKLRHIVKREGIQLELKGLGFTGKAASGLQADSGIKSDTISRFLGKEEESEEAGGQKELWIVDESSMVGSQQMSKLIERAKKNEARVVFIGDTKQLQAIQAGRIFSDIQKLGTVQQVTMEKILRQKTEHMKAAVSGVKAFQEGSDEKGVDRAFALLKSTEVNDTDDRTAQVVDDFTGRENWKDSAIVTPLNKQRVAINQLIHEKFRDRGIIGKEDHEFTIRSPESIQGINRHLARSYKTGQSVFITEQIQGMDAGAEFKIKEQDFRANTLTLEDKEGKESYTVDLKRDGAKISVYKEEQRSFSEGERVVFLKNDRKLKVQNGLVGTIKGIDAKGNVNVETENGNEVGFSLDQYSYLDQGYALTVHKSQGATFRDGIYVTNSGQSTMNSAESFYVALTRFKEDVTIYTDNVVKLKEEVKQGQEKTSTVVNEFTDEDKERVKRFMKEAEINKRGKVEDLLEQAHLGREQERHKGQSIARE